MARSPIAVADDPTSLSLLERVWQRDEESWDRLLYLYAPLRLHHHRRGRDDRHGFGQLTRFLHPDALAACDNTAAAPPGLVLPVAGPIRVRVDAALGSLWDG